MFKDIMGIVIDTEDKWLNKKLNSHICYKGGASEIESVIMPQQQIFEGPTETTSVAPSSSSSSGLEQGSSKVAEARTKLEGALGSLQGLKDGSSGVCSCGKPKGKCNCKGYADGTRSIDELMKEYREKMNAPTENTEKLRSMIREKQKKGYAYGSNKVKGYYDGSLYAEATPQQQQEMMAMAPGVRMQAPTPTPEGPDPMQQAVQGVAMREAISPVVDYAKEGGKQALSGQTRGAIMDKAMNSEAVQKAGDVAFEAIAGDGVNASDAMLSAANDAAAKATAEAGSKAGAEAVKAAGGGALNSALSGIGGAAAADLLTKGKVDEKTLLKGGLAMGANMLLPGSGFLVGPAMSALGLKDGMMEVPPMGYAGGTPGIVGMLADDEGRDKLKELAGGTIVGKALGFKDGTAKMTPEEYQMKFIKERIVEPAEAYVEERPMLQAPLLMAAAARDYERGKLPLGKFGGGKLEGGKDRLAYRHKKYGDFEVNPESERVSYKKTFRF